MVYRVKHGSVWTDQLPRLWVLELVALEMLAGMKPTEMKLSPIPRKIQTHIRSNRSEDSVCCHWSLCLCRDPLNNETWTWISPESLLWQEMTEIRFRVHRYQAFVCLCKVFPTWFLSRMCGNLNMTASCWRTRGVSQHVTQVYSVDQVDQLKAAISCILCGSPGALRNFAQHI